MKGNMRGLEKMKDLCNFLLLSLLTANLIGTGKTSFLEIYLFSLLSLFLFLYIAFTNKNTLVSPLLFKACSP